MNDSRTCPNCAATINEPCTGELPCAYRVVALRRRGGPVVTSSARVQVAAPRGSMRPVSCTADDYGRG
jgi:hypothetical protein